MCSAFFQDINWEKEKQKIYLFRGPWQNRILNHVSHLRIIQFKDIPKWPRHRGRNPKAVVRKSNKIHKKEYTLALLAGYQCLSCTLLARCNFSAYFESSTYPMDCDLISAYKFRFCHVLKVSDSYLYRIYALLTGVYRKENCHLSLVQLLFRAHTWFYS